MKISMKIIATVLAATITTGSMAAPASAFFGPPKFFWFKKFHHYKHMKKPQKVVGTNSSFPWVVGCVMGSAFGLISASIAKGYANGEPLRWMSQAQYEAYLKTRNKKAELTSDEAALIGFSCGLGALPVIAQYNQR